MTEHHTYKLTLSYDGTDYSGWQIQPNAPSIQQKVIEALAVVLGEKVQVTGAGRTDAGVHALGQVAHFCWPTPLNLFPLFRGINGLLPPDIRLMDIEEVPPDFHARFSATKKIYHYHIATGRVQTPFRRRYSHWVKQPLDVDLLKQAAQRFLGTHDFTSYANVGGPNAPRRNPMRTIERLDVVVEEGEIRLEFEGPSFLYKMVRNIAGQLIEIASKKRSLEDISLCFAARDRRSVGLAAPARGLSLIKVFYEG